MRQNKWRVYLHLVWTTWDRLPLITEEIERDLYRYIETICHEKGCVTLAIGGLPDHVHLFVVLSNTVSIADLVEAVKGGSSHFVHERLRPGAFFKWQGNYGAFSVSPQDKPKVMAYIESQKERHAANQLWQEAEETFQIIAPAQAGAGRTEPSPPA
jgi:REP element-mobilizing transposase RayT